MQLPLVEKPLERFDEVLARIDMNRIELQLSKQLVALGRLAAGLSSSYARRFARLNVSSTTCLPVSASRKTNQPDARHGEFALVGDHQRNDVVLAARDFECPLVAGSPENR